jgi:hypothetical protein
MPRETRDGDRRLPPEDDWFAEPEPAAPTARATSNDAAWATGEDVLEPVEDGPSRVGSPRVGRARMFALAVIALLLVAGGILGARWLAGGDDEASPPTSSITLPVVPPAPTPPTPQPTPQPTPTPAPPGSIDLPADGTYRPGDEGDSVLAIQQALAALGFYEGELDGDFGSGTEAAVVAFQESQGITADGVVGPVTLEALSQAIAGSG